jgi:hypothetical protein
MDWRKYITELRELQVPVYRLPTTLGILLIVLITLRFIIKRKSKKQSIGHNFEITNTYYDVVCTVYIDQVYPTVRHSESVVLLNTFTPNLH